MRAFVSSVMLLLTLAVMGCGSGELGPASPDTTPKVTQEQVQESYTKGMPEDYKKRMQGGGKPGGS